ncbi:MAG: hypothetical protein JWM33_3535 [Caulobacteraceae bacterium]|nr:hypothetical protein [Caulobacteraceae bacterium]
MVQMNGLMRLTPAAALLLLASCVSLRGTPQPHFHRIFDGKTLKGWVLKTTKYPLGENPHNMLTVDGGAMKFSFDGFKPFAGEYAVVYYDKPLKNYVLQLEYRFAGQQAPGAPAWAKRNSGVMLFAQPPQTMTLNQSYPTSIEDQLLGGLSNGNSRQTLAVCMVDITVTINGAKPTGHCTPDVTTKPPATPPGLPTFDGDQWVKLRIEVKDGTAKSYANGILFNSISAPHVDAPHPWLTSQDAAAQPSYFALQGESDEVEFRNIELAELP